MTAKNNQQLTPAQQAKFDQVAAAALVGFTNKFNAKNKRRPNTVETRAFAEKSFPKIIDSILRARDDKNDRAERKAAVETAAAFSGVKFFHRREEEAVDRIVSVEKVTDRVYEEIVNVEIIPGTLGGETFAYKYVLDDDNNLYMDYATAFCRSDEAFDPLIGMEVSLDKFAAGFVNRVLIKHEKFGQVKLTQMAKDYKTMENNALEQSRVIEEMDNEAISDLTEKEAVFS